MICEANGIEHRLTKPNHPWSNGHVERMNRTIKEATVKRFHHDSHDQLRTHLADFLATYNFARKLKTLSSLTPYESLCKVWTSEPNRFIGNPIHQIPGLNSAVRMFYPANFARHPVAECLVQPGEKLDGCGPGQGAVPMHLVNRPLSDDIGADLKRNRTRLGLKFGPER